MMRLLFRIFLPHAPEYLLGDLEEEARERSRLWLVGQVVGAAAHEARWLEAAAAAAFLVGLPLVALIALRRYVLTLVFFRESAEFTAGSTAFFAALLGIAAAAATRALGGRWPAVCFATGITATVAVLTGSPLVLTAAAFLGGSFATRPTRQGGVL
jgi:hypothetical protein